jgi:hypothetical protein
MRKLAAVVAASAITLGVGALSVSTASAADNIKTFGEQERLNNPNGSPYIGYTVFGLKPSTAPVPHNGQLYSAKLTIDGFGGNTDPMIGRFGARSESGVFYPAIQGASNGSKLYFDVTGPVPNSVVWNDGVRDILCWIPGETPLEPQNVSDEPADLPAPGYDPFAPGGAAYTPAPAAPAGPVETDPAIVATPNDLATPPFSLNEAEVASPGFNR